MAATNGASAEKGFAPQPLHLGGDLCLLAEQSSVEATPEIQNRAIASMLRLMALEGSLALEAAKMAADDGAGAEERVKDGNEVDQKQAAACSPHDGLRLSATAAQDEKIVSGDEMDNLMKTAPSSLPDFAGNGRVQRVSRFF